MGMLTTTNSSSPTKGSDFWDKKEGKYGKWILGILIIAGVVGFTKLLPTLTEFVMGTGDLLMALARLALIATSIFAVGFFVTRPKMKNLIFYWYRGLMSLIVNGYVNKNYIQIMQTYMERLNEKLVIVREHIKNLSRAKANIEQGLAQYETDIREYLNKASDCRTKMERETDPEKRAMFDTEMKSCASKAAALKKSIVTLKEQKQRLDIMYKVVEKVQRYSMVMVDKIQFNTKLLIDQHKYITTASRAVAGAQNAVMGGDEERRLYDHAMETMTEKTREEYGEIEFMLNEFKGIIQSEDVNQSLYEEAGLKLLSEWENRIDEKLQDDASFLNVSELSPMAEPVKILANQKTTSSASKWIQ